MPERRLLNDPAAAEYQFCLFVSGTTPRSLRSVAALRRLCEATIPGRYQLEVIDVYEDPVAARDQQVVAVPTLILLRPQPRRLFVGDLSEPDKLLEILGLSHSES